GKCFKRVFRLLFQTLAIFLFLESPSRTAATPSQRRLYLFFTPKPIGISGLFTPQFFHHHYTAR
ncbi:unnamed protein product, partial [Linum tenue]